MVYIINNMAQSNTGEHFIYKWVLIAATVSEIKVNIKTNETGAAAFLYSFL